MTSFYGSVNGGQGGGGEGVDTSTLMQKNNPTFNGTITGPNARFTGTVQIPEPTEDNHAATKGYVDAALADVDLSEVTTRMDAIETAQDELAAQLDDKVDAENPAFTGTATLNGKNIATVDQIPNISDLPYLDENNPTYTGTLTGADATFSGVVSVPTPTQDGQAVNKQYVDQAIAGVQTEVDLSEVQADIAELQTGKLDKANPTYTGNLAGENAAFSGTVTVATPAAEGEAANKGYVDAAKTELEGDINTLQQTVANQTETINTLNQQVTNITGGTAELPYLKNTGDSGTGVYDFTGATVNAADPVDNSNVATKHYVDQKIASAGGTGEVVSYTQGDGISISLENEISLSIDSAGANGLKVGTNGLGLDLATATTSGAMAASDKTAIASNTTEITNIKNGTTELPYLKETNPTYEGTLIGGDATFTGSVQVSTPDQDNEAANKSYVDTALAEAKSYTDETVQQIQSDIENIKDGTTVLPYLSSAGGTVTGPIKYGTSPKDTSDLANKAYVDAIHVQAVADAKNYTDSEITNLENGTTELPYIKNNGDTVTGSYDLTGAAVTIAKPASDNSPATKKYVDDSISAIDVSEQISPLTERVTAAEGEIDTLQTDIEAVETSVANITNGTTELPYVKDSGDTVTGTYNFTGANVTIAEPTVSNNPATKNYVDTKIASAGGSGEVVSYTQGNGINISPENIISVVIAADNANGLAVDTNGIKLDVATPTTAGAMSGADKAKLDASSTTEQMNQAISNAIDETLDDPTKLPFVNINGDTMHGSLTTTELFTDFVTIRNAGTDGNTGFQNNSDTDHIRVYDKVANTLVPIEVGEPVNNQDASTKKYVDDKVTTETAARTEAIESLDEAKADKDNPTFTGIISGANATLSGTLTGNTATFSGGITVPLEPGEEGSATSKKYVDNQIASIDVSEQIEPLTQRVTAVEGEVDTLQSNVGTIETNITNITNGTTELPYVKKSGDTVTGLLTFEQGVRNVNTYDPSYETNISSNVLAFKHGSIVEMLGLQSNKLRFSDSTAQTLVPVEVGTPIEDKDAATKGYVDESIEAIDVSAQIAPLTERVTTAENDINGLQTEISPIKDKLTIANRAVFIGDSTSQGYDNDDYSFVDIFEENGDFSGVTKLAVGGATLGPYQIVSEASGYSCLEQIQANESAISDANFCFLQFCDNDVKCLVSKNVQIGTPSDTSTTTTVCGYLKKCIELLYTYNPTISIVFINLATNESVIDMMWDNEVDSDADKYKFYHKVWNLSIADVLEQYNIPMINIFDWTGINANNFSNYTVHTEDGTHLNTAGNTLAYYRIKNALWNESEKSYPTQPKNLIIDAILGGNIGVENVERIKNAFDNNIQVFFNLKESEDSTEDFIVPVSFSSDVGHGSYFTISQSNNLYLYGVWTDTSGQITHTSYNITDMKSNIDTALAAGAEKFGTLESYSGETYTIDSMKPNTLYDLRKVDLPTITVAAFEQPANTNYVWTYHMIFQSNVAPVTLNLPSSVIYPEDFKIEAKHIYEINIIDNLLSYQSWPME